jgi:hypothetical protein
MTRRRKFSPALAASQSRRSLSQHRIVFVEIRHLRVHE